MPRSKKSEIPEIVETDTSAVNLTEAQETEVLEVSKESGAEEAAGEFSQSPLLSDDAASERKPSARRKKAAQPAEEQPPEEPAPETADIEANSEEQLVGDLPEPEQEQPTEEVMRASSPRILTIAARDSVETPEEQEATAWHEIRNAYLTHRILTGMLGGLERTDSGHPLAIVYYNDYRVVIPYSEMMIDAPMPLTTEGTEEMDKEEQEYLSNIRMNKLLNNMLGAEIDFIIKGIENASRSIVASRREAMLRKRKNFYFDLDPATGTYRIYEGRIVQARIVAVAEKGIRVEVFGVECPIYARNISYDWVGDAHERYAVGDEILVRVNQIDRESVDTLSIQADIRSVVGDKGRDNLQKCRVQGRYAGTVTDVRAGVVYVRLEIGVNAIVHTCLDRRTPAKKDCVAVAITRLDEEKNIAVGTITRILRQQI
ncbi:MAG: S1 RNA-binding domain-containing protein [Acutalibacteraceae bacterium]